MTAKAYKIEDGGSQLVDVFNALAGAQLNPNAPKAIRTLVSLGYSEVRKDGRSCIIERNTFIVTSIRLDGDGRLNFTVTELIDTLKGAPTTFEGWYEPRAGQGQSEGILFGDVASLHSASA